MDFGAVSVALYIASRPSRSWNYVALHCALVALTYSTFHTPLNSEGPPAVSVLPYHYLSLAPYIVLPFFALIIPLTKKDGETSGSPCR